MEGGERRRGGTYEHAAAAVREINGDRVEVAVRAAGIGNGGGDGGILPLDLGRRAEGAQG